MSLPKSFDELIGRSETPVLVDFWAEWCGPCRMLAPAIAQIAKEFKGRLVVVKVNVDERPQIAARYGIQSIPTLMIFDRGRAVARRSGALPYGELRRLVEEALSAAPASSG
jgi:thioredoxin 1